MVIPPEEQSGPSAPKKRGRRDEDPPDPDATTMDVVVPTVSTPISYKDMLTGSTHLHPLENIVDLDDDDIELLDDDVIIEDPGNLLLAPIPLSSPPPGINVVQQDNLPVVPPGPLPAASKAIGKSVVASNKGSNPLRSKKAGILVSKNSFSHHAKSATSSKVLRLTGVSKSSTRSLLDRSNHQGVQLADDSHPSIPIIAIAGANSKDGHVAMVE
ncbi:hypothetical protein V6N13_106473 [Hibiscus sabdariffa]